MELVTDSDVGNMSSKSGVVGSKLLDRTDSTDCTSEIEPAEIVLMDAVIETGIFRTMRGIGS